jgi:RNA recognition motif-containing protein
MAKKIYVGNMSYSTTEDQLEGWFAEYGTVLSSTIIVDRYTDRSKGFGFVEMEEEDAAMAAISALNGAEKDGRQIKVNEAHDRPRRDRPNRY